MTAIWSIGRGKRNTDLGEFKCSPGPCAYNPRLPKKDPAPAWTLHGTSSRAIYRETEVPGPGAYKLPIKVYIK